jgi:hypothetical protein
MKALKLLALAIIVVVVAAATGGLHCMHAILPSLPAAIVSSWLTTGARIQLAFPPPSREPVR